MATVLASLLTDTPVRPLTAMTGEITLSGNVLPVGGIKEKVLAARRAGVETIILPVDNKQDVEEDLTADQLHGVTIHYARHIEDVLAQVGLADVADEKANGFSLGMRQRLGLAAALLTRPRLLVLDEPANGLDPAGSRHVHQVLKELAAQGTAVILSSHRMDDVEALCSDVTILSLGRVVFSGPLSKLAAEHRELSYRLVTSSPADARKVASETPGVLLGDAADAVVVRAPVPALDQLVIRLVESKIAIRELSPVVSPLEAAFLALTGDQQ